MSELSLNEAQIKNLMKTAMLELFQEQRELFQDLIAETIEDLAMVRAKMWPMGGLMKAIAVGHFFLK